MLGTATPDRGASLNRGAPQCRKRKTVAVGALAPLLIAPTLRAYGR